MAGRGGSTASSSRGRGGKFKKYTRGGGKHFSRDLQPIDADGNKVSMWSAGAKPNDEDDDDDDDDDDEEDEEDDEDDVKNAAGPSSEDASREDRKAQKKARKEAAIAKQRAHTVEVGDLPSSDEDEDEDEDDDMPANPNHSKAARKQASSTEVEAITEGVENINKTPGSRREREALEAAAAKERYMKLHAAGKTDEAKADLARLKLIREQRATEAARRQAEKEEREEKEKERRAEIEAREAKKRAAAAGPKKGKKG